MENWSVSVILTLSLFGECIFVYLIFTTLKNPYRHKMKKPAILYVLNQPIRIGILSITLLFLAGCRKGEDPLNKSINEMDPLLAATVAHSIESTVTPQLAEGLTLRLWGVDSLVADPISIDMDDAGRLYYTRTNRQKNSELTGKKILSSISAAIRNGKLNQSDCKQWKTSVYFFIRYYRLKTVRRIPG